MSYRFYPNLILRSPQFSINYLLNDTHDQLKHHLPFLEALLHASPELYKEFMSNREGKERSRIDQSLFKYINRSCFRCTPFGLFAGCAMLKWGLETKVKKGAAIIKRQRPDKELLNKWIADISSNRLFFTELQLFVNNTIYRVSDLFRFYEWESSLNCYKISEFKNVKSLEYFFELIYITGGSIPEILSMANRDNYSNEDVITFLMEMHRQQLITTDLNTINAALSLDLVKEKLENLSKKNIDIEHLAYKANLMAIKASSNTLSATGNKCLQTELSEWSHAFSDQSANRLKQIDYCNHMIDAEINKSVQNQLLDLIHVVNLINTTAQSNPRFEKFKATFESRYGTSSIPLLQALDPETGITYSDHLDETDTFLRDYLGIEPVHSEPKLCILNENHGIMISLFKDAIEAGKDIITLDDNMTGKMKAVDTILPTTTSVFFRMYGKDHIQFISAGGSSGINLFARFSDVDESIYKMAVELAQIESKITKDGIIAEVLHEPTIRSGNLMSQKAFRDHEIPVYLTGDSSLTTINLSDLTLKVSNGDLSLNSIKNKLKIYPKITSAYNFNNSSPLFMFLGDLQNQNGSHIEFDFTKLLPQANYFPRVAYKNSILSPRRWIIKLADVLAKGELTDVMLHQYLADLAIPKWIILSEGDNELLISSQEVSQMTVLQRLLKKLKKISLKEFIFEQKDYHFFDHNGQLINNEMVAVLINGQETASAGESRPVIAERIIVNSNSDWLYLKFYSSVAFADNTLTKIFRDLTNYLFKHRFTTLIFFVRYYDPEPHIRLRIKLNSAKITREVEAYIRYHTHIWQSDGRIGHIIRETYEQERERYGEMMEESEFIFSKDSKTILYLLNNKRVKSDIKVRVALGVKLTLDVIDTALVNLSEKISYIKKVCAYLEKDIHITSDQRKKINLNCRNDWHLFAEFINQPSEFCSLLQKRKRSLEKFFKTASKKNARRKLSVDIESLVSSHIHMSVNRLFAKDQKVYEYVVYNYLFKFYTRLEHRD